MSRLSKSHIQIPKRLHIALEGHEAIMGVESSKDLKSIITKLEERILLGCDETGYIEVRISQSSKDEIWPLYEQLYDAIRNVEYEFKGDIIDLTDIKLAKQDKKFQSMIASITQFNPDK